MYEGESNDKLKKLNIYLVIYWTQKVHNDFFFLCSLHCLSYKRSSASEVRVYFYKNSFGWERGHSFTRSRRVCYRTNAVHELPSPSYTCCSDRRASPYWTSIRLWISMGFTLSLLKKRMTDAVLVWCMLQGGRHLYSTTAPSCCIPVSYCHLSATLQTMSIIIVNLQDNRAVFRIFIALLTFSFDSPSYVIKTVNSYKAYRMRWRLVNSYLSSGWSWCLHFQDHAVLGFEVLDLLGLIISKRRHYDTSKRRLLLPVNKGV
jgi:hypothetical protein